MRSATVIICTHNRATVVGRAVEGALAEVRTRDAEVLVVDNASTDATAAVLAGVLQRFGPEVRVVREPDLGLCAARNRGLAEARGEIAVFLDDDAVPRPGWLTALLAPYEAEGVVCVGGRALLRFACAPPAWLTPAFYPAAGNFDLGDRRRRIRDRPGDWFPCGANISFRAAMARQFGGFSTEVGQRGRSQRVHDETDLCARLDRAGGVILYTPDAVVDHWVGEEKLAAEWFLNRHWESGQSAATYVLRNRGALRGFSAVRWYARYLPVGRYVPRDPIDPVRLLAECQRREALGYLLGLARGIVRLRALRRGLAAAPRSVAASEGHA